MVFSSTKLATRTWFLTTQSISSWPSARQYEQAVGWDKDLSGKFPTGRSGGGGAVTLKRMDERPCASFKPAGYSRLTGASNVPIKENNQGSVHAPSTFVLQVCCWLSQMHSLTVMSRTAGRVFPSRYTHNMLLVTVARTRISWSSTPLLERTIFACVPQGNFTVYDDSPSPGPRIGFRSSTGNEGRLVHVTFRCTSVPAFVTERGRYSWIIHRDHNQDEKRKIGSAIPMLHSIGLWRIGEGNADGADKVLLFEPLFDVRLKHEIDK